MYGTLTNQERFVTYRPITITYSSAGKYFHPYQSQAYETIFTLYRVAFVPARKLYRIGLPFRT